MSMRLRKFVRMVVTLLAMSASAPLTFARPPDFPPPPKSSVSTVGNNMVINGRTTAVRMFVTQQEVQEVIEFYQDTWSDPVDEGDIGYTLEDQAMLPWLLVTRVEDGHAMTVQVQPGQDGVGSWGYLADSLLPRGGEPVAGEPAPPSIGGSEVLSNITHEDPGQLGQTAVMRNEFSVSRNVSFYREQYSDWRVDMDQALVEGHLHALRFTRGRQHVVITVNGSEEGAEVVINRVKRDLL
ncbi:MAG: hypothetical protein AAF387_17875 [Pseudomonadota bacterium]